MDFQELWHEHKRWILGVVAGLLVYWVGSAIIGALFDSRGAALRVQRVAASVSSQELYGREELREIETVREGLQADEARVRDAISFVPDEQFLLAGKGDPETWFPEVAQRVRTDVLGRARELSVELADRDVDWPAPVGREEIERTLLGLCVLEHATSRLLDASDAVRREDVEALGLVSIDKLAIEKRAGDSLRRSVRRRPTDTVDIAERIDEISVTFAFRCDVATLQVFLEQLRVRQPRIGLAPDLKIQAGEQIGDPLLVRGRFTAFRIRDTDS